MFIYLYAKHNIYTFKQSVITNCVLLLIIVIIAERFTPFIFFFF